MGFQPSDIVFVTGGNGHVSQHVLQQLLSHSGGPKVRTSVRSASSASKLKSSFTSPNLEIMQIGDITTPNAFSSALEGVTHLAHIASPLIIGAKDTENELLIPAIDGTTEILKSALQCNTLKSVVLTSSFAAVVDALHGWRSAFTYTPSMWNPITYEEAASPDLDLNKWPETWRPYITYMASKKLAEKAAWELYASEKPSWDFSVILPTYIGGPVLLDIIGEDDLSWSNGLIWKAANDKTLPLPDYPYWVDVRDVAHAHIAALQSNEASGKRFILAPKAVLYSDIAAIARKNFDGLGPTTEEQKVDHYAIDTSNTKILGFKSWIPIEKTVEDLLQQVLAAKKKNSH